MRTTITLEADVAVLVKRRMRERGVGFKDAVNDALRAALSASGSAPRPRTPTYDLGEPTVPLDKALQIAAELEDGELRRKLAVRK